ncbi:MAG TPA: outer membrane lipid asymmetry maintenance protein MlaD [Stellaceae bacterium]|nr:outer membrane lipid asymmetry maintenance protein MlaD [Stellaceae bacterium]
MSRNVIETVMGAVVLVIAALFLIFAYSTAQVHAVSGYEVTAKFSKIDGVREGGDVRISGIKVGSIVSTSLDPKTYEAVLTLSIDPTVKLPTDTVASIVSSGLLGDKYLALLPGSADEMIKPGGQISYTNAPVSIEDMISKYIFNATGSPTSGGQGAPGGGAAPPSLAPAPGAPGPGATGGAQGSGQNGGQPAAPK